MQEKIERASIPDYLLYGFAIASIGGPLALVTIYLFSSTYMTGAYSSYAMLFGTLLFIAPLMVWYRYSKRIASSGGQYTFVKRAVGEKTAKLQGWLWLLSYFLYLPYTVTYITYSLLPFLFHNLTAYLPVVQIALPILIVVALMLSFRKVLYFIFVTVILQLLIILLAAYAMFSGNFVSSITSSSTTSLLVISQGVLATSLLFVCSSLVLFLGGEAEGGAKSIRKSLIISFAIVVIFFVIGSLAIINATTQQAGTELPGFLVLGSVLGIKFAYLVAIFSIISVFDLIIIELIAITRLSYSMLRLRLNKSLGIVAMLFIFSSVAAITHPNAFYGGVLTISLVALYLSQVIVFVAYPFFAKKELKFGYTDILIAVVASLLMLYGLYTIIAPYIALI